MAVCWSNWQDIVLCACVCWLISRIYWSNRRFLCGFWLVWVKSALFLACK